MDCINEMLFILRNIIKHVTKIYTQWLYINMNHQHTKIIRKKTRLISHEFFWVISFRFLIIFSSAYSSITQGTIWPDISIMLIDMQFLQSISSSFGTEGEDLYHLSLPISFSLTVRLLFRGTLLRLTE